MTHTLRGAEKGVGQTDKQSRAEHLCAWRRAPNGAGTYCWCPGFCHTERKCHHLSNNENWKQFPSARKRQAEREKGGEWEREGERERSLSWDQIFVLVLLPLSSSPALHNFISHSSTWGWECCCSSPAPSHIFTPSLLSRVMFIFNAAW